MPGTAIRLRPRARRLVELVANERKWTYSVAVQEALEHYVRHDETLRGLAGDPPPRGVDPDGFIARP